MKMHDTLRYIQIGFSYHINFESQIGMQSQFVSFISQLIRLFICTISIPDIIFVYIKYIFVNYTDLLTTDFPRGCTNCEARISNFCCSTAWNGICCEFPLKKKQVSNKHSQNSTKQQKFHFTIANQSGPRLRWQMKICDDSWLVSDRTQILGIPTYPSRV